MDIFVWGNHIVYHNYANDQNMRILDYLRNNHKAILKESLWTFFILVLSVSIGNAGTGGHFFGDNPTKYLFFLMLMSIPGGIGSHLLNERVIKKNK